MSTYFARTGAIGVAATLLFAASSAVGTVSAQGALGPGAATSQVPVVDARSQFTEKLGGVVPMDLQFVDQDHRPVTLARYFERQRPVILNLGYYGCPAMCGVVLNGLLAGLQGLRSYTPANDFTILTVSIDPNERPPLAREKKNRYLQQYFAPGASDHWHFLTGDQAQVQQLADAVGFGFFWNERQRLFDHPAGLVLLSPTGKVTRYLYGTDFDPSDLRKAIAEASEGKVGSSLQRLLDSCFTYDPVKRTYTFAVMTAVRIAAGITVGALALTLFLFWRRERRRPVPAKPEQPADPSLPATQAVTS